MDLGKDKTVAELISRLEAANPAEGAVKVEGTWGSFAPCWPHTSARRSKRPILYICPHIDDADNVGDDLQVFTGKTIQTFPAWEGEPSFADATDEIAAERLRVAMQLASNGEDPIDNFHFDSGPVPAGAEDFRRLRQIVLPSRRPKPPRPKNWSHGLRIMPLSGWTGLICPANLPSGAALSIFMRRW